jgi:hypothetical protein
MGEKGNGGVRGREPKESRGSGRRRSRRRDRRLKGAAWRERDRKGNIGTAVHNVAEAYVLEAPYAEPGEDVAPYVRSFLRWLEDFRPVFQAVEAPILSRTQKYAGTLDAIVDVHLPTLARRLGLPIDRPLRVLVDYKTGSNVFPETGLQLAAYRYGEVYIRLPDASEEPLPEVDLCAVVHLSPDGYRFVPVRADKTIWESFLYVREVYQFQEALAPSVVGRDIRPEVE